MRFKKEIEKLLLTFGDSALVTIGDETTSVKALIRPMRYKNKLYINMERTDLGFKDSECFLYLGPSNPDFSGKEEKTVISSLKKQYLVSRADRITLSGETVYIWAVLTPIIKDGVYDYVQ